MKAKNQTIKEEDGVGDYDYSKLNDENFTFIDGMKPKEEFKFKGLSPEQLKAALLMATTNKSKIDEVNTDPHAPSPDEEAVYSNKSKPWKLHDSWDDLDLDTPEF